MLYKQAFLKSVLQLINAALSPFVHDPNLVKNYAGIAFVTFVTGNIFYLLFRHRDNEGQSLVYEERQSPPLMRWTTDLHKQTEERLLNDRSIE